MPAPDCHGDFPLYCFGRDSTMGQVSTSFQNVICGTDDKEIGLMILHCMFNSPLHHNFTWERPGPLIQNNGIDADMLILLGLICSSVQCF